MPIKFRCPHCRQFLGISQSKAGAVVDCPTCGRSVRVPKQDGRVGAVPKPELDLKDSGLTRALDELAAMAHQPAESARPTADSRPDPATNALAPIPLPDPLPIDPPAPIQPLSSPPATSGRTEGLVPAKNANATRSQTLVAVAGKSVLPVDSPSAMGASTARPSVPKSVSRRILIALAVSGTVFAFGSGYLIGRRTVAPPSARTDADRPQPGRVAKTAPRTSRTSIAGRITYKTAAGDSQPDSGARVIVLPSDGHAETKLSLTGFRPADNDAEFSAAESSVRALGGDLALVGEDGTFEVVLPAAGTYHVLVLSHYQSRDAEQPLEPAVRQLLEKYFDRPEQLLGRLRFHVARLRYAGKGTIPWDHSFEQT